jgi:hypothetical protein
MGDCKHAIRQPQLSSSNMLIKMAMSEERIHTCLVRAAFGACSKAAPYEADCERKDYPIKSEHLVVEAKYTPLSNNALKYFQKHGLWGC